ncbi:protein YoaL [Kosakonia sp. BK9b]
MFILRLISQEYRALAHSMDRHRRQFTFRPFCAAQSGVFRHFPNTFDVITPVLNRTPFRYSLSRSFVWNS